MKMYVMALAGVVLLVCMAPAKAQIKKPGLFIGGNVLYSSPGGQFAQTHGNGIGGEATAGLGLGKTFVTATYGSTRFVGRQGSKAMVIKPLRFGLKQYMLGRTLYVSAEGGNATIRDKTKATETTHFMHGLGAGLRFGGIEGGITYNGWTGGGGNGYQFLQYKLGWSLML